MNEKQNREILDAVADAVNPNDVPREQMIKDMEAIKTSIEDMSREERPTFYSRGVACKGSWQLGTACRRCDRCRDEAVSLVEQMLSQNKRLIGRLASVAAVVPKPGDYTLSEKFRLQCFEELQQIIHGG